MEIFDTHAHYDDSSFDDDRSILLGKTLPEAGVVGVISAGTTVESSRFNASLAQKYDYVYFAAGIQPEETEKTGDGYLEEIAEIIKSSDKAVAVGEIGLDYHWKIDKPTQKRFFEEQLILANELNKPVIIHDREAHADTLELVKKYKPRGTLHCFSGSAETAMEFVRLGLYIGFTGAVTFKNNKKAPKVIEVVPIDRILVETDCPYMAPEPLRGRRSDSTMIEHTLAFIARIKGVTTEEMAHITAENARRLFNLN
ncbi:TatD family hydrolase [[Clostridium] cellulosi]